MLLLKKLSSKKIKKKKNSTNQKNQPCPVKKPKSQITKNKIMPRL